MRNQILTTAIVPMLTALGLMIPSQAGELTDSTVAAPVDVGEETTSRERTRIYVPGSSNVSPGNTRKKHKTQAQKQLGKLQDKSPKAADAPGLQPVAKSAQGKARSNPQGEDHQAMLDVAHPAPDLSPARAGRDSGLVQDERQFKREERDAARAERQETSNGTAARNSAADELSQQVEKTRDARAERRDLRSMERAQRRTEYERERAERDATRRMQRAQSAAKPGEESNVQTAEQQRKRVAAQARAELRNQRRDETPAGRDTFKEFQEEDNDARHESQPPDTDDQAGKKAWWKFWGD